MNNYKDPLSLNFDQYNDLAQQFLSLGLQPSDMPRLDRDFGAREGARGPAYLSPAIPYFGNAGMGGTFGGVAPLKDGVYARRDNNPAIQPDVLMHEFRHRGANKDQRGLDYEEQVMRSQDQKYASSPYIRDQAGLYLERSGNNPGIKKSIDQYQQNLDARRQAVENSQVIRDPKLSPTGILASRMDMYQKGLGTPLEAPRGPAVAFKQDMSRGRVEAPVGPRVAEAPAYAPVSAAKPQAQALATPKREFGFAEADAARKQYADPAAARQQMVASGGLKQSTRPDGATSWSTKV